MKCLKMSVALLLSAALFLSLCSCSVDPDVKQSNEQKPDVKIETTQKTQETRFEGNHAYKSGKTDPVELYGVKVDVCSYALRSYELAFMMGLDSFDSPEELSVDALVQFALTHIYYDDFYLISDQILYKDATEAQVEKKLKEYFGNIDADITRSVLYSPKKEKFEMWVPEYGTSIYYNIDSAETEKSELKIITTFYNEFEMSTMLGRTTVYVGVENNKPVIKKIVKEQF